MAEQVEARDMLFLAAEMGLGKTVAVLTAIGRLKARGRLAGPVLVIAPLLVAKETWPAEIEKWEHTRHLTYSLIRAEDDDDDVIEACRVAGRGARALASIEGHMSETVTRLASTSAAKQRAKVKDRLRRQKVATPADIHIINRELLPWLKRVWRGAWPYKFVVYDEASRLKGGKKKTAKPKKLLSDGETLAGGGNISEFGVLNQLRPFFDKVIELSGTPAPKGLHDLWGPFKILDMGARLGATKTDFDRRWFYKDHDGWTMKPHEHSFDEIMGRVKDVMISLKERDYLELPPRIDHIVPIHLPSKVMEAYRKFEKTLYLEMHDIEAVSSGVLTNKLLQFANGSVYDDNHIGKPIHDLKIKALESIVEEAAGAPILVAYEFKFDLVALKKRWPKAVIVGEKNWLQRWDRGEIDMLICHPASASHGLNLQFGGSIGVWYGLTWSLELFQQFIKRLHRQGQKADRVILHYILAVGTVDYTVWEAAHENAATQEAITDAVRIRLDDTHRRQAR
jgi:SNF2 family DNA or RNA helicase